MTKLETFALQLQIARNALNNSIRYRQGILEGAYAEYFNGGCWRVVGITKKCLESLRDNDYNYQAVKPVRSHLHQRRETYVNVIESDMTPEEALQYIHERDIALLSLRSENKDDGSLKAHVEINPDEGYFMSTAVGYKFTKKNEVPYLQQLVENHL